MKQVADNLRRVWQVRRVWQGSQVASNAGSNAQATVMAENRDRSSMAEFVRILQTYDKDKANQATGIEAEAATQAT